MRSVIRMSNIAFATLLLSLLVFASQSVQAAPTVINTADAGAGSLRQAIIDAPDWQAVAAPPCPPPTPITGNLGQGSNDYPSTSGVQTGRLSQNGVNSSCATQKPTPSIASAGQPFAYDAYEFTNGSNATACVTFTFPTSCGANQAIHPVAYLGSFDPNNPAANYLGDFGNSINANDSGSFSVNFPANATVVLVVHRSGTVDGCPNYTFSVTGLPCPPPCPPTPITGNLGQGSIDYPSTSGVQTGRLGNTGVNSSCGSQKPTPSIASAGQPFAYDAYEFTNYSNATACVTFTFPTSCGANQAIHPVAYLDSFDPNNPAANYLGDFGSSINLNDSGSFTVNFPANATVVLVVHRAGTVDGCPNYSFSVTGLQCPPAAPSVSVSDVSVTEGNAGTTAFVFTVTLSNGSANPITVDFTTQDTSATVADGDYVANAGTLTFAPNDTTETITVLVNGDMKFESNEQFLVLLNNATGGATFTDANAFGNITNDDALPTPSPTPTTPTFQFDSSVYTVEEGCTFVTGHVLRTGPSGTSVSVDVTSDDGSARQKGDYNIVLAHLVFAAGETDKTFQVLINDDGYTEGLEVATLLLQRPTGGVLGIPSTAGLQITDNSPETSSNPIDGSQDFVCQHYHDFLYRQADQAGQDFWINVIESCGTDTTCRQAKRVEVSTAFFLSIEFQQTGYFVIRAHKAAFGNLDSNPRYTVFLRDQRQIGEGVIVGEPGFQQLLDTNRQNYLSDFVSRPEFVVQFPLGSAAATYVDRLFLNAGATPTTTERSTAISAYGSGDTSGRIAALKSVIESGSVFNAQYNAAFVLMQYYGYLRRNPDDPPDNNFSGYDFWLAKMNSFTLPGEDARDEGVALHRVRRAEMVRAFIVSSEFLERFFGAADGNQQGTVGIGGFGP